ncbi:MAG: DUF3341 domain-containing protein [Sphingomonadales bacterium]
MGIIDKNLSLRDRNKMLLGIWENEDKLVEATSELVHAGVKIQDVYTPYPVHGLERIMGVRRSWLSIVAFLCGMTGFSLAFWMIYYMYVQDWPIDVGNKPVRFSPSWVPVLFEATVLCTAFGMAFFFFFRNRMIWGIKPELLDDRQTDDRMVIAVETGEGVDEKKVLKIMKDHGAVELREKTGGVQTTI